jgi:hypothetical protein
MVVRIINHGKLPDNIFDTIQEILVTSTTKVISARIDLLQVLHFIADKQQKVPTPFRAAFLTVDRFGDVR